MNVIMHYSKDMSDIEELKKRVASVHIEAVNNYLNRQNYPMERKMELIESLKNSIDKQSGQIT
ncbi:hypothetical protein [Ructibacterium gallinarum]|uniref:Uncharacterized protein n=1 Tax=Ructibacterium gallinarum TaxID=2779355 RepID=A0A9D5M0Y9_9FIRM|nr:hypothetical protein [Ructibacterium gallinarum]MBE5040131.1 hypothetical protein [Ructibacterium gallinarum]